MPKRFIDRPHKYRKLRKKLKKFGVVECITRGKGSERILYHPNINGKPAFIPVKCHGEGTDIGRKTIRAIRERFNISLEEFYKPKRK